jgi:hypothetical protein
VSRWENQGKGLGLGVFESRETKSPASGGKQGCGKS